MTLKTGVVDYGMGNLHSVAKALCLQGCGVSVLDQPSRLEKCDLMVLPGVGAFGAAMESLKKKGLVEFIQGWLKEKRPFLGICLGFQLLFETSQESPGCKGLGIFEGSVVRFDDDKFMRKDLQIPHMGWNTAIPKGDKKACLFKGIKESDYFYFVHSFFPVPKDSRVVCTETIHGNRFCSSLSSGNIFASQFHLEKSGRIGLRLLGNFVKTIGSRSPSLAGEGEDISC